MPHFGICTCGLYKAFHYLGKGISMFWMDFHILCDHAIILRSFNFIVSTLSRQDLRVAMLSS